MHLPSADVCSDFLLQCKYVDFKGPTLQVLSLHLHCRRGVLVQLVDGLSTGCKDITPSDFNVRALVHEYGGGAFTVDGDIIIFSNYKDQRLYLQFLTSGDQPVPLTPEYGGSQVRYADGVVDRKLNRFITVRDHRIKNREPINEIVAIQFYGDHTQEPEVLVTGNHFYSFPRLNRDASKIAWIEWSHPNLPWDKTELWIGDLTKNGKISQKRCLAGSDGSIESPTEPNGPIKGTSFMFPIRRMAFGISTSGMEARISKCKSYVGILDLLSCAFNPLQLPFTDIYDLLVKDNILYVEVASASHPLSVAKVNLSSVVSKNLEYSIVWSSNSLNLSEYRPYLTKSEIIEFPTERPDQTAFTNFYPPYNNDYCSPAGGKPPLIVRCHGRNLAIQFWTSRGWAVADANYGGSTGYGREYRGRLYGAWGIVDVEDCCSCAKFMVRNILICF
ncbi:hypothetical protein L7F22_042739 [Adiantum nelumboides]|nr:hypothetical protein [Adiantum nelumboides]